MEEENPEAPPDETPEPKEEPANQETPTPAEEKSTAEPPARAQTGECISPTPSGEDLPQNECDKIMTLTLDILHLCQQKVDDQKISSHSLSFMLLRVKESLFAYINDYIPKLNTFLVHADTITAEIYGNMCNMLPQYGDYVKAIQAEEGDTIDVGWSVPVAKQELIDLVKNVTDNYYAEVLFVKNGRSTYKDVNSIMHERYDMVKSLMSSMPDWLKLQDNVTKGLEDIREQTFKISAYLDFLKQGESKIAPALDLTPLSQYSSSGDATQLFGPNSSNQDSGYGG